MATFCAAFSLKWQISTIERDFLSPQPKIQAWIGKGLL